MSGIQMQHLFQAIITNKHCTFELHIYTVGVSLERGVCMENSQNTHIRSLVRRTVFHQQLPAISPGKFSHTYFFIHSRTPSTETSNIQYRFTVFPIVIIGPAVLGPRSGWTRAITGGFFFVLATFLVHVPCGLNDYFGRVFGEL